MKATIRKMGSSQEIIVPRSVLAQVGIEGEAEIIVEKDCILLRHPRQRVREGWAEASQRIAMDRDDKLVWPAFANEVDGDLQW